jgi:hypothetical protein
MYDVAKAMKVKEIFIGSLEMEGRKDQTEFFSLKNEFEKNLVTGQVKVKINTLFDLDGKQVKHESNSEFNIPNCCSEKHHHHHLRKSFHSDCCNEESSCCCSGLKGKLSTFGYLLRLLDKIEIEELENNVIALSLKIDEIPEDLMKHIHGKFQHHKSNEKSPGQAHCCMNELMTLEKPLIAINVQLNSDKAIEKIVFMAEGKQNKVNEVHEMTLKADLNLKW